ncbi:hypothetical protein NT2_06_02860 [Caenibius tardaugens NBRC 16725]|uniref:Inositol monophosphatase n=2 Tax=Caenibius TaxID=2827482 RepID=U2Y990_9SPHN|nr:hypothetical protein NT2_06_02860 [Caenibius tardaugens NBRC 16725]
MSGGAIRQIKFEGLELMQLLHLVMGGRVKDPQSLEFENLNDIDLVGVFGSYAEAEDAWRGNAQRTVDDAEMKYVIVHLHKLLEPALPES